MTHLYCTFYFYLFVLYFCFICLYFFICIFECTDLLRGDAFTLANVSFQNSAAPENVTFPTQVAMGTVPGKKLTSILMLEMLNWATLRYLVNPASQHRPLVSVCNHSCTLSPQVSVYLDFQVFNRVFTDHCFPCSFVFLYLLWLGFYRHAVCCSVFWRSCLCCVFYVEKMLFLPTPLWSVYGSVTNCISIHGEE